MLEQLKEQFNNLVKCTNKKVDQIEKALGQELPAYRKMATEIDLTGLSVIRGYKPLNDEEKKTVYKLKIDSLKYKLKHSEEFLLAVTISKDKDLTKKFDLFRDIDFSVLVL